MARMLQALKNLEARSVRPAGGETAAPTVKSGAEPAAGDKKQSVRGVTALRPLTDESGVVKSAMDSLESVASAVAGLQVGISDAPGRYESAAWPNGTWNAPAPKPVGGAFAAAAAQSTPSRPATGLERLIRRTLGDRSRAQPLVELADRLRRDLEQAGAKRLMFVGVGAASRACETLLYAATLLAEEGRGRVLLVDGDLARGGLSEGLEYQQERGLTELLREGSFSVDACRQTSVQRLSFLPVGMQRHADLSSASTRLAEILERLDGDFSYVLVDGGRTSDLSVNALARQADAAYLVVQLGTVETSEAQAALAEFRAAGARVLGCIAT